MANAMREAQSRADQVSSPLGFQAPPPVNGEDPIRYRRRLLEPLKRFSPAWKAKDLTRLDETFLDLAEKQIFADAAREARHPSDLRPGELREVIETDRAGRRITRFVGDPEGCWGLFKAPVKRVVRFNTK